MRGLRLFQMRASSDNAEDAPGSFEAGYIHTNAFLADGEIAGTTTGGHSRAWVVPGDTSVAVWTVNPFMDAS